jgi:hypothetical protein
MKDLPMKQASLVRGQRCAVSATCICKYQLIGETLPANRSYHATNARFTYLFGTGQQVRYPPTITDGRIN